DTRPISITEAGFQPHEIVRLTDETCGSCAIPSSVAGVADPDGVLSVSILPVADPTAGMHVLKAQGDSSGVITRTLLLVSQLTAPPQLVVNTTAPSTFSLRGFHPRAAVSLTSNPAGALTP